MPLFDHLGELRRRLTIVVVSVFAAAIVLYFATPVVLGCGWPFLERGARKAM